MTKRKPPEPLDPSWAWVRLLSKKDKKTKLEEFWKANLSAEVIADRLGYASARSVYAMASAFHLGRRGYLNKPSGTPTPKRVRNTRDWTPEEEMFLMDHSDWSLMKLSRSMQRSQEAIKRRQEMLGVATPRERQGPTANLPALIDKPFEQPELEPEEVPDFKRYRPSLGTEELVYFDQGLIGRPEPKMTGCRWIEPDINAPNFKYTDPDPWCNKKCKPGASFCQEHYKRAYNRVQPAKRRISAIPRASRII